MIRRAVRRCLLGGVVAGLLWWAGRPLGGAGAGGGFIVGAFAAARLMLLGLTGCWLAGCAGLALWSAAGVLRRVPHPRPLPLALARPGRRAATFTLGAWVAGTSAITAPARSGHASPPAPVLVPIGPAPTDPAPELTPMTVPKAQPPAGQSPGPIGPAPTDRPPELTPMTVPKAQPPAGQSPGPIGPAPTDPAPELSPMTVPKAQPPAVRSPGRIGPGPADPAPGLTPVTVPKARSAVVRSPVSRASAHRSRPPPPRKRPAAVGPQGATAAESITVEPGDNLWSIAATVLEGRADRAPTDREVAAYWLRVIEVNRAHLPDPADPSLLFPGDVIALPPA